MGVLGLPSCFGIVPHPHSYEILTYFYDCSFPELGKARVGSGFEVV